MHQRTINIIILLFLVAAVWLGSFHFNEWLSLTMPRHQVIQLPVMLLLGVIAGFRFSKNLHIGVSPGIAILIFIMASIIFWMLPRSVDLSVINVSFNRIMHINMLIAGYLMVPVLRKTLFEVKVIFLGMLASMTIAVGITLKTFDILLCSAFDIFQQKETGTYLIYIGVALYIFALAVFFSGLGKSKSGHSNSLLKPDQ